MNEKQMAEPQNKSQRLQAHLTRVLHEMQQAQQGTRSRQGANQEN